MPPLRLAIFVVVALVLAAFVAVVLLVVGVVWADRAKRRERAQLVRSLAAPGRAMGFAEHAFDFMHHMGVFVVGQAALVEGALEESALRGALDALQRRHPLLRAHVRGPYGVFFGDDAQMKTSPIALRVVVAERDDAWKGELLREVREPIPYGPSAGVRVVWVSRPEQSALLIVANHAVYDGASSVTFVRELLTECGRRMLRQPDDATSGPPHLDPLDVGLRGRTFPPRSKAKKIARLPARRAASPSERRPGIDFARVDADTMKALLAACRNEKTTIHGALSAAALFAAAAVFGGDRAMSLSSNVSVRRELTPAVADDAIGCFISGVTTTHFVAAGADLWDVARSVRADLTQLIAEGVHLRDHLGEFGVVHEIALRHVLSRVNQGRLNAINLSNSGRFDLEREFGPLILRELYALATQDVMGSTMQIAVMSLHEELFVSFSWPLPLLSADEAAEMKRAFLAIVAAASRGEPVRAAQHV